MDKKAKLEQLIQTSSENNQDVRENTFYNELKDQQKLIEYELREEQRLLNSLPGTPPMTFGLGSKCRVKYLGGEVPEFVANIVADNVMPDFTKSETPLSVHTPLVRAIYGKINGTYRVVVDEEVYFVEVAFC